MPKNEFITKEGVILMNVSSKKYPNSFTKISPKHFPKVAGLGKWFLDKEGYVVCNTPEWAMNLGFPTLTRLHRFIGDVMTTRKWVVDHINKDRLDNRIDNLRLCKQEFNAMNKSKWKKSKGQYKGTVWNPRTKSWISQITILGKTYYLGTFKTEEAAAIAFNIKAVEIRNEFACINEIKNWTLINIEKYRIKKDRKLKIEKFKKLSKF